MASSRTPRPGWRTPTVVLLHGAFSDASTWSGVIALLQEAGLDTIAPAVPLRGLASDGRSVVDIVRQRAGPVLLVGACYSGAVITVAGAAAENVVGLVYVAGFALDEGESWLDVARAFAPTRLAAALRPAEFVDTVGNRAIELYVKADEFRDVLAGDLSARTAAVMAAAQRPIAAAALEEKATAAAWKTLPAWYLVASADHAVDPAAQRRMARRAGAQTTEAPASHSVTISQTALVADLIATAARSTNAVSPA